MIGFAHLADRLGDLNEEAAGPVLRAGLKDPKPHVRQQASAALDELSERLGREIEVRARPGLHQEQFEVTALDRGDPVNIPLRWLGDESPPAYEAVGRRDLVANL